MRCNYRARVDRPRFASAVRDLYEPDDYDESVVDVTPEMIARAKDVERRACVRAQSIRNWFAWIDVRGGLPQLDSILKAFYHDNAISKSASTSNPFFDMIHKTKREPSATARYVQNYPFPSEDK